jgi:hypothetical protein
MRPVPPDQISPYPQQGRQLLPARRVADYYGVHLGSVRRWVVTGVIPPADVVINRRRYWFRETLEAADRRHTAERAKSSQPAKTGQPVGKSTPTP